MSSFDLIYIVILAVCGILSLVTSLYVKSSFHRGAKIGIASGLTGADVARRILRDQDVSDVQVVEHQGFLSDHYNPMSKTLALSPDVYNGRNAAAAGVAAHEVGHALQHAQGDLTMWARSILVYPAHYGSMLGPGLVIAGIMLGAGHAAASQGGLGHTLALAGVGLFGAATLCSIFIVFNEFNASSRARALLIKVGITRHGEEDQAVRAVLLAAGLTYLAAAIGSILQLLYWAWKAGLIGGRRE